MEADAEMAAMVIETLAAAGLKDFQLSIGNVEYFKGICMEAGLEEETERTAFQAAPPLLKNARFLPPEF